MKTTNYTKINLIPLLFSGLLVLLFASCGTHNSNDYGEQDGIYSNENEVTEAETTKNEKDSYYKQYFKTKELAYKDVPEENAIFTDIDEYYTTETVDEDGYIVEEERESEEEYGAWGTNTDDITINIYGGYSYGYWHRPLWWYGSYWGYPYFYGYGWGYPYYWGIGYYGWGYPYYGYYGHWYGHHHHYYGNGYYNSYAYNRGRRNTSYAYARDNYTPRGRTNLNSRRGDSYSRLESNRRNALNTSRKSNNDNTVSNRRNTVSNNGNTVSTRRNRVNSNNVSQNRNSRNNNTVNKRSNTVRRNTNSRSNNFNNRSTNSRRSSGTIRSSGSSRSSGSMRSGGGSSRGSSSGSRRGGRG